MNWRPVHNYEGYYEINDVGTVRGLDRIVPDGLHGTRTVKGRIIQQTYGKNGYAVVNLHKYGMGKVIPVHRLVAEAFINNPHMHPAVNHIDGNKRNNRADNLEWVSYAYNNVHALRHSLRLPKSNPVVQMDDNGCIIAVYRSVTDASRQTGVGRGMISHAVHGREKRAGGYLWKLVGKCNDYPLGRSTAEDELRLEVQERREAEDIVWSDGNI